MFAARTYLRIVALLGCAAIIIDGSASLVRAQAPAARAQAPAARAQAPAAKAGETPFVPRPLARIPPGTRIADRPPAGWSYLIMKTQPRITAGDVESVPDMTKQLASMFFTALMSKVVKQEAAGGPRYSLSQVAIGLGTHFRDDDTIVSSATWRGLGADLGLVGGIVLSTSEKQLDQTLEIARTPTMLLVDSPSVIIRNGAHVEVVLRYAFLVDPRDGRPSTLVWVLAPDGDRAYRLAADTPVILIKPNLVSVCDMHVDSSKFFLGTPSEDAFAVLKLPQGSPLRMSEECRPLAVGRQFTPATAYRLELGLWKMLFPAGSQ
jgi:hypothetical protein